MANKDFEKRIASEQQCMKPIKNDDLVCKSCIHKLDDSVKLGNTSVCEVFELKPGKVLLGGDCDAYEYEG